jgi:hypothetical protein
MTRIDGWQDVFFAYLEIARVTPFQWGVQDCCLFAADVVDTVSGTTLREQLSLCYTDETTALAYIASFGTLEAAVSSWLGTSEAPNSAGPGDIVIATLDNGPTVGVCLGVKCAFASIVDGPLLYTDRSVITACWPI